MHAVMARQIEIDGAARLQLEWVVGLLDCDN